MPAIRCASRFRVLRRHVAWLIVLALTAAPGLNPLTQRLGSSVTERAGLNKRSEHPPKKIVDTVVDTTAVSPDPAHHLDTGTRPLALPHVGDCIQSRQTLNAPDSLRAPPLTLSL